MHMINKVHHMGQNRDSEFEPQTECILSTLEQTEGTIHKLQTPFWQARKIVVETKFAL